MTGMRIVAPLLWLPALAAFASPMAAWGLKGSGGSGTRALYAPAFIGRSAAGRERGGHLITELRMADEKDNVASALAQPAAKPTMPVGQRTPPSISIYRVPKLFGARARSGISSNPCNTLSRGGPISRHSVRGLLIDPEYRFNDNGVEFDPPEVPRQVPGPCGRTYAPDHHLKECFKVERTFVGSRSGAHLDVESKDNQRAWLKYSVH